MDDDARENPKHSEQGREPSSLFSLIGAEARNLVQARFACFVLISLIPLSVLFSLIGLRNIAAESHSDPALNTGRLLQAQGGFVWFGCVLAAFAGVLSISGTHRLRWRESSAADGDRWWLTATARSIVLAVTAGALGLMSSILAAIAPLTVSGPLEPGAAWRVVATALGTATGWAVHAVLALCIAAVIGHALLSSVAVFTLIRFLPTLAVSVPALGWMRGGLPSEAAMALVSPLPGPSAWSCLLVLLLWLVLGVGAWALRLHRQWLSHQT
ncbi:hypothetical protein [Mycetocola saprophilus]|uniref:hypothetical protein n=1 Tax=Mycetocola saprophilus TaxID=76636 RepID=UPI003BEF98F6